MEVSITLNAWYPVQVTNISIHLLYKDYWIGKLNMYYFTSASIGAWKWNFPPFSEIMTDRVTGGSFTSNKLIKRLRPNRYFASLVTKIVNYWCVMRAQYFLYFPVLRLLDGWLVCLSFIISLKIVNLHFHAPISHPP